MHWQFVAENIAIYMSIVVCSVAGFWLMESGVGLWSMSLLIFINFPAKPEKK